MLSNKIIRLSSSTPRMTRVLTSVRIADEKKIRNLFGYAKGNNPRRRSDPAPRPDYAVFGGSQLRGFADAKFRDVWERGLTPDWLYQLFIYALASPQETSVCFPQRWQKRHETKRLKPGSQLSGHHARRQQ
jgi:hypothetical protein